ncbi:alkaline phosphatase [Halobacteriales archaeon QS_1_67_19]|nr:MAG: alkaline phosphatase [Halobacteriales archaeon QS_1_67_19]
MISTATVAFAGSARATRTDHGTRRTTQESISEPTGVKVGDIKGDRAVIWSRADRPARMIAEIATTPEFDDAETIRGPWALENNDFTAKLDVDGLPQHEEIFYRVYFEDLEQSDVRTEPLEGTFRTPPAGRRDVRFVWGGDVAGQGWGINPEFGGYQIFETMRQVDPDFLIHSGDAVYADDPLPEEQDLPDGGTWANVTTDAKTDVADTLDEFRGNYRYNLRDEHLRRFNAEVPVFAQWDDHEVLNNWYPGEALPEDNPHDVKSVDLLAARGQRAYLEYMPTRTRVGETHYDSFPYGPSLEVFRLDMRNFRGPNTTNDQQTPGSETAFLGREQLDWLKRAIHTSDATWKVIAADQPISLVVPDGDDPPTYEAVANADDGAAQGRELEIAELLAFLEHVGERNVVWLTADVHYTAAIRYDPGDAQFAEFDPFWEFVTGPFHAGTFGPNELDRTFGPTVEFERAPDEGESNLPPSAGLQFFGQVDIDGSTEVMTVTLKDIEGSELYTQELSPER